MELASALTSADSSHVFAVLYVPQDVGFTAASFTRKVFVVGLLYIEYRVSHEIFALFWWLLMDLF
jgi:hypothetical protein